jgi:tetratricopeptide (TPR) repeat protein/DNA-binding XRE family transcriptional regulator
MSKPSDVPNELFKYEREKREWTQNDVAEKINIADVRLVRRWESGEVTPLPHNRAKLAEVFGKSARALGFPPDGGPSFWSVPYRRNAFFTGRDDILPLLRVTFLAQHTSSVPRLPLALSGLAGVGKSQIALEYAYRYREHYHTVLWLRAASSDVLVSDVTAVTHLLDLPEKDAANPTELIKALKDWLKPLTRWLLIFDNVEFDNVENVQLLDDFLSTEMKGHVLLTTLSQITGTHADPIAVEHMHTNTGAELLLRRARLLARESTLEHVAEADKATARSLSEDMGGLPLALDQAGAYIGETKLSLSQYAQRYREKRRELLATRGSLIGDSEHPIPIAATLQLSIKKACERDPLAANILNFCAFLHPDAIPEELFQHDDSLKVDPIVFDKAIAALLRYSLIKRNTEKETFSIHRLVQAVLIDEMDSDIQKQWRKRVVRAVNEALPERIYYDNEKQYRRLLPHALVCATWSEDKLIPILGIAALFHKVGDYLYRQGQLAEAETLLTRAISIYNQYLRFEYPDALEGFIDLLEKAIADALEVLAGIYFNLGKFSQMEPLLQQALTIHEKLFGTYNHYTLPSLDGLADLYTHQCKYTQAEAFLVRALFIRIESFGLNDRSTISYLHHLAAFYSTRRAYDLAEFFYRKILKILEKRRGAEHPGMLGTLYKLVRLLAIQGNHEQAEAFYRRAVNIQEQQVWEPILREVHSLLPDAARKSYASFLHYIGCDAEIQTRETDDEPSDQVMEPYREPYRPHSTSSFLRLYLAIIVPD